MIEVKINEVKQVMKMMVQIRKWLLGCSFMMIVCLFSPFAVVEAAVEDVTLTWMEDTSTTQTITWRTSEPQSAMYVEYINAGSPNVELSAAGQMKAEMKSFVTDEGTVYLYTATLRGLVPDSTYMYRIGSGQAWGNEGTFRTAAAAQQHKEFKFLVFGDSQSFDYNVWQTTLINACGANRDAKFFVNNGDLVDNGQTYQEWKNWFGALDKMSKRLPVVPVVGNHEAYKPGGGFSMPVMFTEQFKVPQNGPVGLKGQVYSLDYQDVHLVVLDTQFGEERAFLPNSLALQKKWLEEDLAKTDKKWKVVFMHRPAYHNRIAEDEPDVPVSFVPIFDQYGVDVVFTAHDHVNARTPMLRNGIVVKEGGTVYATTGRSGTKSYDTMEKKSWNETFVNGLDMPTYSVVAVADHVFYVRVFKQNGELLDEWSLVKVNK